MNEKLALLGQPVRAQIGGHRSTIFLIDYDESSDSYHGILVRCYSMNPGDVIPYFEAVHGLRRYPYTGRMNYEFQFVLPGEDEQVLTDIVNQNIGDREKTTEVPTVVEDELGFDAADTNRDGKVSDKERRKFNKS